MSANRDPKLKKPSNAEHITPPPVKTKQQMHSYWEDYNNQGDENSLVILRTKGQVLSAKSYSHLFFRKYKLEKHLNTDCKRMLQLGASNGAFLSEYKKNNWKVMGYDASPVAIGKMERDTIPHRLIDLDTTNQAKTELAYRTQLHQDLSQGPCNILAIRLLQYLDSSAAMLLIFDMINLSSPGSTIFIAGTYASKIDAKQSRVIEKNYIASFFAPRTDILFLTHHFSTDDEKSAVARGDNLDAILVVRKK